MVHRSKELGGALRLSPSITRTNILFNPVAKFDKILQQ